MNRRQPSPPRCSCLHLHSCIRRCWHKNHRPMPAAGIVVGERRVCASDAHDVHGVTWANFPVAKAEEIGTCHAVVAVQFHQGHCGAVETHNAVIDRVVSQISHQTLASAVTQIPLAEAGGDGRGSAFHLDQDTFPLLIVDGRRSRAPEHLECIARGLNGRNSRLNLTETKHLVH